MRILKLAISWAAAFAIAEVILAAFDLDANIFKDDLSNAGSFFIKVGIAVAFFYLTYWLLERLPYFRNKRGG